MVKEEKKVTVRIAPNFNFDGWNETVAEYKGVIYSYDKGLGMIDVPKGLFKELKAEEPRRFYDLEEYAKLRANPVKKVKSAEEKKAEAKVKRKAELDKKSAKKLADVAEDLADDGKRNYSHDPKRKSPGRKKKK